MKISDQDFAQEMLASLPKLRTFARFLSRNSAQAEDLVQQAMLQAWESRSQWESEYALRAWLFTILRNCHYDECRRRRREIANSWRSLSASAVIAEQSIEQHTSDLDRALRSLPALLRDPLLLVTVRGLSYQDTARVCGCKEGTLKSRISRARAHLSQLVDVA